MLSYTETADFTSACAGWVAASFCWHQQCLPHSPSLGLDGVLSRWRSVVGGQARDSGYAGGSPWVPARASGVMEWQLQ